jgi:hypothetical protein
MFRSYNPYDFIVSFYLKTTSAEHRKHKRSLVTMFVKSVGTKHVIGKIMSLLNVHFVGFHVFQLNV